MYDAPPRTGLYWAGGPPLKNMVQLSLGTLAMLPLPPDREVRCRKPLGHTTSTPVAWAASARLTESVPGPFDGAAGFGAAATLAFGFAV